MTYFQENLNQVFLSIWVSRELNVLGVDHMKTKPIIHLAIFSYPIYIPNIHPKNTQREPWRKISGWDSNPGPPCCKVTVPPAVPPWSPNIIWDFRHKDKKEKKKQVGPDKIIRKELCTLTPCVKSSLQDQSFVAASYATRAQTNLPKLNVFFSGEKNPVILRYYPHQPSIIGFRAAGSRQR